MNDTKSLWNDLRQQAARLGLNPDAVVAQRRQEYADRDFFGPAGGWPRVRWHAKQLLRRLRRA